MSHKKNALLADFAENPAHGLIVPGILGKSQRFPGVRVLGRSGSGT
jgi:hypothetical protein